VHSIGPSAPTIPSAVPYDLKIYAKREKETAFLESGKEETKIDARNQKFFKKKKKIWK